MKKITLLVFAAAMLFSCVKVENASEMSGFTGTNVKVGDSGVSSNIKLLILNEGAFPGASTLDVLSFSGQRYYADIYGQANPNDQQGLGNTGNDMIFAGNRIWIALNASNRVVGINPKTFLLEVDLGVPSPRSLIADEHFLYVTSYGAAVYGGSQQIEGALYRFGLNDPKNIMVVGVGYQPEGVAIENGKIFVANSGGYNFQHDNRITVIDQGSFKKDKDIELPVTNLNMLKKGYGKLWISTYGESSWKDDGSGNWIQTVSAPMSLVALSPTLEAEIVEGVHADKITECKGIIYAVGNNAEMTGGTDYCLYKVNAADMKVETVHFAGTDLAGIAYPYCIYINPLNEDIYIADASFTSDSTLWCFSKDFKLKWSIPTGVGTGHLLLYQTN